MPRWVPCVVFLYFVLKFKPFDQFFLFQNVTVNLSLSVARVCVYITGDAMSRNGQRQGDVVA